MADRPRAWVDAIIATLQSGTNLAEDLLAAATVNLDTITVARLVVGITATPDSFTSGVSGVQRIDMGIGVASTPAFDIGVTALPDPRVASDAPPRGWLWRGSMSLVRSNVDGSEKETGQLYPTIRVDLGAMRKVDRGTLFFVTAKTAIQGSELDVDLSGLIRVLCLT